MSGENGGVLVRAGWALTLLFCGALVACESAPDRRGVALTKPLASLGFLLVSWAATQGTTPGTPARALAGWTLAAQLLSALGDVLLITGAPGPFLAGLVSFLVGHLCYALGFARVGLAVGRTAAAALGTAAAGGAAWRWLAPHLPPDMVIPVAAYMAVISAMVVAAAGATADARRPRALLAGAVLFFVSDLCVARERFVAQGFVNQALGLPLYYVAQLLLGTAAGV